MRRTIAMRGDTRTSGWYSWPAIIVMFMFCWPVGLFLLIKRLSMGDETSRYLLIINKGRVRSLDSIAIAIGKPYAVVREDIQRLINNGTLQNAYINESTRGIVFLDDNPTPRREPPAPPRRRAVTCPHCGANNIINGANGICEYCDSPIE